MSHLQKMKSQFLYILAIGILALGCSQKEPSEKASDSSDGIARLNNALGNAQPGDTVKIPAGEWRDAVIHFEAKGDAGKPIVLAAEKSGSVVFSGKSKLFLSGQYGVVSGIWFKEGESPDGAVISFESEDGKNKATHCRVTDCAITNYSLPERLDSDHWIEMHGNHNRFDHNYIGNKQNLGTTMVVRLNKEESQANFNKIDHNYFGPRSRMGSNGGETMRVGTSAYSLSSSYTTISHNYFERCNGEVEIVSIKSSDNFIDSNVFDACEGVLTMRHGNRNKIRGNYFLGRNQPFTGGIRVINAGHTIEGNYLNGLKGHRFHAALPVMNGVPNSPINRYHQVKGVSIKKNLFIHCNEIAFGTGSDKERTATPTETAFTNNTIYTTETDWSVKALDDISGVQFAENQINIPAQGSEGFSQSSLELYKTEAGLEAVVGLPEPKLPVLAEQTGPAWFDKDYDKQSDAATAKVHELNQANKAEVVQIVASMNPGDTLWVSEAGDYPINEPLSLDKDICIIAKKGYPQFKPDKSLKGNGLFEIKDGARVWVKGIHFSGRSTKGDASYGITSIGPMLDHYRLSVDDCRFSDFNESRFVGINAGKSTFADSVEITNCWFKGFSGHAIAFSAEKDDYGRYNVENIKIDNCVFANVMGMAIDVYRGGNDESTLGPFAEVSNCNFITVNNKELGSVVRMLGVQYARLNHCTFVNSGASGRCIYFEDPAWADIEIWDCKLDRSGRIQTFYDHRVDRGSIVNSPVSIDEEQLNNWTLQLN